MVVLSVAICTKNGRALLSRQFVEMTRMRIEGLLAAFPKLIGVEGATAKQHTFVETENVRYVYLPLESLYLLLITNKGSNIIEDLDTLRLLIKVVPEQLGMGVPVVEENISARAFELLFAFDEVLSAGGYREAVTLHAIRTNLEMESHEEKLAAMIKASKMAEAKEAAKRKEREIKERMRDEERAGRGSRMQGFGSSSPGYEGGGRGYGASSYGSSANSYSSADRDRESDRDVGVSAAASSSAAAAPARKAGAGMKLGSKKPGGLGGSASGALAGVMAEEGIRDRDMDADAGGVSGATAAVQAARAAAEAASANQASVVVEERVTVRLSRDGGCEGMEVKGTLSLVVHDESAGRLKLLLKRGDDRQFQYQTHPNINKQLFTSDGVIAMKSLDKAFPVESSVGVVRWRWQAKDGDSDAVPLLLNVWPEAGAGGNITVNMEYTLQREDLTLNDVIVTIPLGTDEVPRVANCDGVFKHNMRENVLAWRIDSISGDNATGSMEFSIKARNADAFFPVRVSFTSSDTLCPIALADVVTVDDGKQLRHSSQKSLATDEYTVE